jgi:phosphohistidine phosphatase SixA
LKRLTLVRHAKSSWKDPELTDFDRPLSKRGKRDAPLMGERLAGRDSRPELILSSPAKRARKTAKLMARKLELAADRLILEAEIYEAEPEALLKVIRGLVHYVPFSSMIPPDVDNLLAVGRCIDGDPAALSSVRVMGPCIAMGTAAAHALDLAGSGSVHQIDIAALQDRVRDNLDRTDGHAP